MSVSTTVLRRPAVLDRKIARLRVTFDSSYPTGGEVLAASAFGLKYVEWAECDIRSVGGTVNVANVYYKTHATNPALNVVQVFDETPAEVTDTSSLATLVVDITAYGY